MILKTKRIGSKFFYKIRVPNEFAENTPSPKKLIEKTAKFCETGELEKIYIDERFSILDGYCSYLIASVLGEERTKKKLKIVMVRDVEKDGVKNG